MAAGNGFEAVRDAADLRRFCEEHLEPKGRTFVCPACGSGTGPKGTPAFSIAPGGNRWKCFACGRSGDVFDLYGIVNGCEDDRKAQLTGVADWAGADATDVTPRRKAARKGKMPAKPKPTAKGSSALMASRAKVVQKLIEARGRISDPIAVEYLARRGFSLQAAERHGIGFTPAYKVGRSTYPAILVPYPDAPAHYVARILDPTAPHKYEKPRAALVGPEPLWNPGALRSEAFAIVEGQLDALAAAECGLEAVALGTTGSRKLIEALGAKGYAGTVVIMLDADAAGMDGAMRLADELDRLHATTCPKMRPAIFPWPDCAGKDPAEWFAKDPRQMRSVLGRFVSDVSGADWTDAVRRDFGVPVEEMTADDQG